MTTKSYVVNAPYVGQVTGAHPRTGVDRVAFARRGEQIQLDPNDERTKKLLTKKFIRPEGEMSDADAAKLAEETRATEQLTKKGQLQLKAGELGIAFEDKTTIPQLESLIAEKEEKLRDERNDPTQTGAGGPDPDAGK